MNKDEKANQILVNGKVQKPKEIINIKLHKNTVQENSLKDIFTTWTIKKIKSGNTAEIYNKHIEQ